MDFNLPIHVKLAVACRLASNPLGKNSQILGHKCLVCKEALQITADGLELLTKHPDASTLCCECAMEFADLLKVHQKLAGVVLTNEAENNLARAHPKFASWLKEHRRSDA